jgi:TonB-linked SusC/RagA family outer membrane protein
MAYSIKTKVQLFFLLCTVCLVTVTSAQTNIKVSVPKGSYTIKEALQQVEKQTQMSVAYNESKINGNNNVSLDLTDRPLNEALSLILAGTGYTFQIKDGYIMIISEPQTKTVSGTVIDRNGAPLPGTSVVLKGSTKVAMADAEGKFTLHEIENGQTLVFSFVGYQTKEVIIGRDNTSHVELAGAAESLDEVVVTALGIKRAEKALSYNVQTVSVADITIVKQTNVMNSLAGKAAGVNITAGSAGLGGASRVVMRGAKSIDQSNNALYVIDGIPMYNFKGAEGSEFASSGSTESIADINPEDIESISILTGAAAAALYGNQGANGAIVITTKKGVAGKLEVSFSSSAEVLAPLVLPKFQNRYGTGDVEGSRVKSWGALLVPENSYGYDPTKDFFKTGTIFTNALSVATGNDKNQTYFSAAMVNGNGIVPNNQYDRYNFTFRNTTKFLNDKITLDIGGSYIIQKDQNMINQGVYSNPVAAAYLFPRGNDFELARVFERYNPTRRINEQFWEDFVGAGDYNLQNPYWAAYRNLRNNDRKRYMFNASVSYDIFDWLNLSGRVRVDNANNDYTEKFYASTDLTLTKTGKNGFYSITKTNNYQSYADFLVNINKRFDDWSIVLNAGASINDMQENGLNVNGPIRDDGIPNVFNIYQLDRDLRSETPSGWRRQSQALLASAEVGYKGAYYLTVTARNDWESVLAETETPSFFYPSVGLSLVLSEALNLPRQIDYLKVRTAYTQVGNPIPIHISIPTYEWKDGAWSTKSIYPIRRFKPEKTTSWEIGLTAKLLQHFHFDFSWYYANTENQTFNPGITPSSGYSSMYVQTGNVRNTGIETSLAYSNKWGHFAWNTNLTFGMNSNKIEELVKNLVLDTGEVVNIDELQRGGLGRSSFLLRTGGSLGDLYSTKDLLRDSNGYIYIDQNGNAQRVNSDYIYLGSVFPKSNLSWRNDFSWKNLHLSVMLAARFGGVVYSQTQATLDLYGVSERSAAARDAGGVPVNGNDLMDAEKWYSAIAASGDVLPQYYTYSATNVRLQELSLGYAIPKKILWNVADVTVSLVAHNLWMIYCKAPFDPETTASTGDSYYQGVDYFMMPNLRNIGFNLKVKF